MKGWGELAPQHQLSTVHCIIAHYQIFEKAGLKLLSALGPF